MQTAWAATSTKCPLAKCSPDEDAAAADTLDTVTMPCRLSSSDLSRFGAHTMARFLAFIPVAPPALDTRHRWRIR